MKPEICYVATELNCHKEYHSLCSNKCCGNNNVWLEIESVLGQAKRSEKPNDPSLAKR